MFRAVILLAFWVCFVHGYPSERNVNVPIVSRATWGARAPRSPARLNTPVPLVVIHHTSVPAACFTNAACQQAMRAMQNHHQNTNGWSDIGYNFAVGSDGLAYMGRGWTTIGAHAAPENSRSIGIALIGHWVSATPPQNQLTTTRNLIAMGVRLGHIRPNYQLLGHRQISATQCPGDALFRIIGTWRNFSGLTATNSTLEANDEIIPLEASDDLDLIL